MNWDAIQHFTREEFECKCGCGQAEMDPGFVKWLDSLRQTFGRPIRVTSGYRCPEYNQQVSSTGLDGPHTTGAAVDVGVSHADAYALLWLAINRDCKRIGINQRGEGRFLHFDFTDGPRPRIWTYA